MHESFDYYIANEKTTLLRSFPLVLVCFTTALVIDLYVYRNGYNWPPIRSDGFGYYLYLPAIFIHRDIFFNFLNDPAFAAAIRADYPFSDFNWAGLSELQNGFADKYPAGTAILQAPFFLAAWAAAKFKSIGPLSGFELPFQVASSISGAFYFAAGIYLLFRILVRRTTVLAAYLCLLFVTATTNVLLYASYDAAFSHIYSFFLVSALCSLVCSPSRIACHAFAFGLLLGLAVILRPTNIVAAVLVARLRPSLDRRQIARTQIARAQIARTQIARTMTLVICGAALGASPQAAIWLQTSGSLIHYSYGSEGFDFLHPQLPDYLFSLRKGAFFWHPAYLLMILSLTVHYRKFPQEALIFLTMIVLNLYVGSAWNTWWFGGSFGSRQTIDVLPVMAIAAELAKRRVDAMASGLVVGIGHAPGERRAEETVVGGIYPQHGHTRHFTVPARGLDQRVRRTVAEAPVGQLLTAAAPACEVDHAGHAARVAARQGERRPAARRFADDDRAFVQDIGLLAHQIEGGLDILSAVQAGSMVVRLIAVAVALGPFAAGVAVAAAQRQDHDISALDEPR